MPGDHKLEDELHLVREELSIALDVLGNLEPEVVDSLPPEKLRSLSKLMDEGLHRQEIQTYHDRSELARELLLEKSYRLAKAALRVLLLTEIGKGSPLFQRATEILEATLQKEWPEAYMKA